MSLGYLCDPFGEKSIQVLFSFCNCIVCLLVPSFMTSLYILDINPFSDISLANIFSIHPVVISYCKWFPLLCKNFLVWCHIYMGLVFLTIQPPYVLTGAFNLFTFALTICRYVDIAILLLVFRLLLLLLVLLLFFLLLLQVVVLHFL